MSEIIELLNNLLNVNKQYAGNVFYDKKQMQLRTTDGTETPIVSYDLPNNCSIKSTLSVVSRDSVSGDTYSTEIKFVSKRTIGVAKIVGQMIESMPAQFDSSMNGCVVNIDTSGTALSISVSGLQDKSIDWLVLLDLMVYQDNSFLTNNQGDKSGAK